MAAFPTADVGVSIVWTPMLAADSLGKAREAAQLIADRRVQHYYDPDCRVGRATAEILGWQNEIAWDIYLFYRPGATWDRSAPAPAAWMYQLREHAADGEHFRRGPALYVQLQQTMALVVAPANPG